MPKSDREIAMEHHAHEEDGLEPIWDLPAVLAAIAAARAGDREQLIADGWRQCAKGQSVTQFCGMANDLMAQAYAAASAAEHARCVRLLYDAEPIPRTIYTCRSAAELLKRNPPKGEV